MTNKEAIEMFKAIMKAEIERIPSHYDAEVDDDVYDNIDRIDEILQLNKIVIKALEKQESKTIYECIETKLNNKVRYDKFRCSVCGFVKEFVDGHTSQYKFCPQCGLEIDWSEEDDR